MHNNDVSSFIEKMEECPLARAYKWRKADMPFKSAKQKRAMFAAAAGKSRIGISKAGAKKFIAHTKKTKKKGKKKKRRS